MTLVLACGVGFGLAVLLAHVVQGGHLMAAIDDLTAAVSRLQTSADTILAKLGSADQSGAIAAAAAAVNAVSDKLDAAGAPPTP